jgi:hypothetical protein
MKNMIRNTTIVSLLFTVASMAFGAVPPISVTVSDASGKAAYKGTTSSTGVFATAKLQPGNYVVQLNSKSSSVKGNHYAVVVSAGKKKVAASAVPGEKLIGGGVALKVDVGAGLNITGQVAAEANGAVNKSGKKMVWIPPALGSNMPGHWAEEDSAEAKQSKTRGVMSKEKLQQMQDKAYNPQGN